MGSFQDVEVTAVHPPEAWSPGSVCRMSAEQQRPSLAPVHRWSHRGFKEMRTLSKAPQLLSFREWQRKEAFSHLETHGNVFADQVIGCLGFCFRTLHGGSRLSRGWNKTALAWGTAEDGEKYVRVHWSNFWAFTVYLRFSVIKKNQLTLKTCCVLQRNVEMYKKILPSKKESDVCDDYTQLR